MIPLNLYRPLQYIESTGTQYIDTGIVPNGTDNVSIKRKHVGTGGTTSSYFGCMSSASSPIPRFSFGKYSSSGVKSFCGFNITQIVGDADTNWHTDRVFYENSTYYVQRDNETAISYAPLAQTQSTLSAYIFARHGTSGVQTYDGEGTAISYIDWKDVNGKQRAYFIPAQRISDSVIGMYDDVTGEFFTNAGTGSFVAGPVDYSGCALINVNGTITPSREAYINDNGTIKYCEEAYTNVNGTPTKIWQAGYSTEVSSANPVQTDIANAREIDYKIYGNTKQGELPDGYTQLEYITNGSGTRVDTGIACSDNMEFYVRTECNTLSSYYLLQRRGDGVTTIHGLTGSSSGATILLSFNGVNCQSSITRTGGHVYQIKGTVNNGNLTLYVKDETDDIEATNTSTYTVGTLPTNNICLCGNLGGDYLISGQKIYDAYIKKDGSYVWKIKGATYNGTTGVYNTVNGVFTTPGTGSFTAGPACPTPSAPLEIKGVGDLVSSGEHIGEYKVPILQAQNCGVEHLGTSNWVRITRDDHYNFTCTTIPYKQGISNLQHFLTAEGYTMSGGSLTNLPNMCYQLRNDGRCEFRNDALGGDVAAFKSAMSGKYLYYPRETDESFSQPTITPIYTQSPIYKVGTYTDTLLSAGLVNRKVGVKVLTGDETVGKTADNVWWIMLNSSGNYTTGFYEILCSHFQYKRKTLSALLDGECSCYSYSGADIRVFLGMTAETTAEVQAFLAAQYAAGTPVTIVYPLATPTTEIITAPSLSTVKGTNIFDTQCTVPDSQMTVDYIKKTK